MHSAHEFRRWSRGPPRLLRVNRVTMRVLGMLTQFSEAHPWSHNEAYSPWLLWQARLVRRRGGNRALDVGCGTGLLLKRLSGIMPEVVGIEPDDRTAARARVTVAKMDNATVLEAPFDPVVFYSDGADASLSSASPVRFRLTFRGPWRR